MALTAEKLVSQRIRNAYQTYKGSNCRALLAMMAAELGQLPQVRKLCCDFHDKTKYPERPMLTLFNGKPSVYLLGWREGDFTDIHDHGDCEVGVYVIQGTIIEDVYAAPPRGRDRDCLLTFSRFLRAGDLMTCPKQYIHQVGNVFPEIAASLHVYGPALSEMRLFEMLNGVLQFTSCWGCNDKPQH